MIHRSEESSPRERGEAFGRAQAPAVQNTVAVYRRLIGTLDGTGVQVRDDERLELEGIAGGAGVEVGELLAVNARTELMAPSKLEECSVAGGGALLAQNWDWHQGLTDSTLVWIVQPPGGGWYATLTEAGLLAKIGLNHAGLGVCLNLLQCSDDGGLEGTPVHVLLRRLLAECTTVEEALALLCGARVSASSAVTVATPGELATVELSPGGANVVRGGFHTNHFLVPPAAGVDSGLPESHSTELRLEIIRTQPLLEALRSHEGHPWGVCRHGDDSVPWEENTVTLASVIMDLAARRLRVAFGRPCVTPYTEVELPIAVV
jgi:isopenicillin-N N-acyltransferase like protein